MTDEDEHDDGLDALVHAYLEAVAAGEEAGAVLERLCRARPDQAAALRRGVELLRRTRLHPGPAEDGLPDRVGPFRLLRRLGVGGMGVVYLARQEAPRREVALKLVRPDQLWFEGYRERFEREIQSAARLAHPGIAQVHEVGEHDGVPWFTQEFVVGAPLDDLLASVPARSPEALRGSDLRLALEDALDEELPATAWDAEFFQGSWTEVCLRIVRQVADALQHAHERGVLHRDVKPSNVLLSPAGRAVLVDFGLASLQGTERLTRSGAQLGSLHYMPPEQLDGRQREVGPASDVYSLGVTLYELLTLRAPYSSQSVQRLRGLILAGDAPRPRRLNRAVGRDAEVVCLTAIDPRPERRYATAADLAADLSAVLGHRPVAARPTGPLRRLARWSRRRPALAVGAVAGFLLFVVAPLAFAVQAELAGRRTAAANDELEAALGRLERALGERDALLDATLDGFENVVRSTAHDAMEDLPWFQEERLRIIDEALAVFARVVDARPDDGQVLLQRALLLRTRGNILTNLGREDEAADQFEAAAGLLEREADRPGADPRWLRELASIRFMQANNREARGRARTTVELRREAVRQALRAVERDPDDALSQTGLASFASTLATDLYRVDGATPEVARLGEQAIEAGDRAVALDPTSPEAHEALFLSLADRAVRREASGELAAALDDRIEAGLALARARELDPRHRGFRLQEARAVQDRALLELRLGAPPDEAVASLRAAVELATELAREFPELPDLEQARLEALGLLGFALGMAGEVSEGRRVQERLVEAELADAAEHPDDAGVAMEAVVAIVNLTGTLHADEELGRERFERMLALCARGDELLEVCAAEDAGSWELARARMYLSMARGTASRGLEDDAGLAAAIEALRGLDFELPERWFFAAQLLLNRAELTGREALRTEAVDALAAALEAGFSDLGAWRQAGIESACEGDPRIEELAETLRSRAEGER